MENPVILIASFSLNDEGFVQRLKYWLNAEGFHRGHDYFNGAISFRCHSDVADMLHRAQIRKNAALLIEYDGGA